MPREKVLIVDDDKNICELLRVYLEKEGYNTIISNDGEEAMVKFHSLTPDIVLLDIMLPGVDGWQICKEIRQFSNTPIIMLSAKSEIFDRVLGLELGADDYIVKPFDAKEVLARIKAVSRRTANEPRPVKTQEINYDKLSINLTKYVIKLAGKVVDLPPKEIELMFCLASHPNKVFTRNQLLDEIWGFDYYGDSRTIDVHIKRLRAKICGVSKKWDLITIWGVGYKFYVKE